MQVDMCAWDDWLSYFPAVFLFIHFMIYDVLPRTLSQNNQVTNSGLSKSKKNHVLIDLNWTFSEVICIFFRIYFLGLIEEKQHDKLNLRGF